MSKKRNIIEEIEQKRSRSNFPSRSHYFERLHNIKVLVEKVDLGNHIVANEMCRYIPLTAIAATETFFRLAYKDIIDKSDRFLANGIQYIKDTNIRLDIDFLYALSGKKVTVGEIVSHQLQLNNLNDITHTLTKMLGTDFLQLLKSARYPKSILFHERKSDFKKTLEHTWNQ